MLYCFWMLIEREIFSNKLMQRANVVEGFVGIMEGSNPITLEINRGSRLSVAAVADREVNVKNFGATTVFRAAFYFKNPSVERQSGVYVNVLPEAVRPFFLETMTDSALSKSCSYILQLDIPQMVKNIIVWRINRRINGNPV